MCKEKSLLEINLKLNVFLTSYENYKVIPAPLDSTDGLLQIAHSLRFMNERRNEKEREWNGG